MEAATLIERGLADLGLTLPAGSVDRLAGFLVLMKKWNRGQNLTAVTEPRDMVTRHVLDSLAGLPWLEGTRVLDVGSGAGLPGIPLAVAEPSRELILLDSRGKRIQFLLHAKQVLKLDNVAVVQGRFEEYRPDPAVDTLTARAFAALPELIRRAMPLVVAGARLVIWQRNDPGVRLEEALAASGGALGYRSHAVRVPGIKAPRHIVVVDRARPAADQPPRRGGKRPE
jgi:16S rRNA (guanine527-N7)-methyltransferase